jgi:ribitol-5-phosphate 2-dehydrogenase (NADP+) / D-ribitol-5-phosphate cytidylyltransferase
MRLSAFGVEPEDSLLAPRTVAEIAIDVLTSNWTGAVVDARREDAMSRPSAWS